MRSALSSAATSGVRVLSSSSHCVQLLGREVERLVEERLEDDPAVTIDGGHRFQVQS